MLLGFLKRVGVLRLIGVSLASLLAFVLVLECTLVKSKKMKIFARFLTKFDEDMMGKLGYLAPETQSEYDPLWSILVRLNAHNDRVKLVQHAIADKLLPEDTASYGGKTPDGDPHHIPDYISSTDIENVFTCFSVFCSRRYLCFFLGHDTGNFEKAVGLLEKLGCKAVADFWRLTSISWKQYFNEYHHVDIRPPWWQFWFVPKRYRRFFVVDLFKNIDSAVAIAKYVAVKKRTDASEAKIEAMSALRKACECNLNGRMMAVMDKAFREEIFQAKKWADYGNFPVKEAEQYLLMKDIVRAVTEKAIENVTREPEPEDEWGEPQS